MRKSDAVLLAALLMCLLGAAAQAGASPRKNVVMTIQDPAINEASGLVARDGDFLTVNDSGDLGRVFVVDGRTGNTIGETFWSDSATDVEAIAAAKGHNVWVGDIGDNLQQRPWIEVTRLSVREGYRARAGQTFRLAYPKGPFDAETLLVHPVTGRLYVATKIPFAEGQVYEAPETLRPGKVNNLTPIGNVGSFVTDGAFFPDGRHVILRGYRRAMIYSFPKLRLVGEVELPVQPQGEGIAVSADGKIFIGSEGEHQPVLRVRLPASIRKDIGPTTRPTGPGRSAPASPTESSGPGDAGDSGEAAAAEMLPWLAGGLFGVGLVIGAGGFLHRRSRKTGD